MLDLNDESVDAVVFDPPYHNNVNYAELSDFYYVWLKRTAGYVLDDEPLCQPPYRQGERGYRQPGPIQAAG